MTGESPVVTSTDKMEVPYRYLADFVPLQPVGTPAPPAAAPSANPFPDFVPAGLCLALFEICKPICPNICLPLCLDQQLVSLLIMHEVAQGRAITGVQDRSSSAADGPALADI